MEGVTWTRLAVLVALFLNCQAQLRCFPNRTEILHRRQFFYNGKSLSIMLEGSLRVSQNITNQILKILLVEVIGYSRVEIRYEMDNPLNTSLILDRIAGCPDSECEDDNKPLVPKSMINLEVPVPAGFSSKKWTSRGHIVDAGLLGPRARLGWFVPTYTVEELWREGKITDHWRSFSLPEVAKKFSLADQIPHIINKTLTVNNKHICDSDDCVDGIFYGPGCTQTDQQSCALLLSSFPALDNGILKSLIRNLRLPIKVAWIGHHFSQYIRQRVEQRLPVLFFGLYPEVITSTYNFTAIKFPSCHNIHPDFRMDCDFDSNLYSKFVWNKIQSNTPEAYHVVSKMFFNQSTYQLLLRKHSKKSSCFEVACDWLKGNDAIWKQWIPENLSVKPKIYLLGLFPLSGSRWKQPGLKQGAELAVELVNQDKTVLPDHDLEIIYVDTQCKADVAMKEYIKYVQNFTHTPVAGVLGPACSDEAEPIASLSKHFNMLTISYGAEASSLSDRVTYPYFYRTIPQVNHHKFVYEKFFHSLGWTQVGALAEVGQELPEYHLSLKDYLKSKGISVIVKHNIKPAANSLDVSQIFADLRQQNVKIIIADFFVEAARAIMCEAYRQRMTAHEGYVWFLPSWYSSDWWNVDKYNQFEDSKDVVPCTTAKMRYAVDGHFMLSKTFSDSYNTLIIGNLTVGQYKQRYAEKVGRNDVASSPYAGFVYDAVWVYALGLDQLLKMDPSAFEKLHAEATIDALVSYINKTQFQGVSGHVRFEGSDRPGNINILQFFHNGTRVVGCYTPAKGVGSGTIEVYKSKIRWLTPGNIQPGDGQTVDEKCVIEDFRALFGVSCEMAVVIANVIGVTIFIILVIFILVFIKFRYDVKMRSTHDRMKELGLLSSDFSQCFSLDEWEMSRDKVVLNRKLGEGAFGTVFGGEAYLDNECWVAVAVKTLKIGSRVEEKIDFLSEADIMKRFKHPNIVQLLGVCTREEPVYAIMEFHLHGDLKTYLLSRRNLVGQECKEAEDIAPMKLTQMALDIASGLKYIHDLKYVHRDLACRNCLVHSSGMVKIGDFGMTRPVIESDYYRFTKKGMLPVRWMSPESLWDGLFTAKSDIWSYGVIVFEIVTFGSFPFQGLCNAQVLEYVKNGNRLILPGNCPEDLCTFIYSCMAYEPGDRYDIEEIMDRLIKMPDYLKPCLDAPTTSVVIDDSNSIEMLSGSCQNTMKKSHSINLATFLNRLSQTSQDNKRFSGGSQGMRITTPSKYSVKTFVPPVLGRTRSSSMDALTSDVRRTGCDEFYEIQNESPRSSTSHKFYRHSHEIPSDYSFSRGVPLVLVNSPGSEKGDATSDYFSDNSKEQCQNLTIEMCQTITSL